MPGDEHGATVRVLREWLRNERRLGNGHLAVPPAPARTAHARPAPARPAPARPPPGSSTPASQAGGPPPREGGRPRAGSPPAAHERSPAVRQPVQAVRLPLMQDVPGLPEIVNTALSEDAARVALTQLDTQHVRGCTRCGLHAGRTQTVFGVGRVRPELVFVGEGPGADEDAQGEPFVGRAGQLLTRMIAAMTLTRDDVYICNVVKCRPPGNRTPTEDEMEACGPFLIRQLAILRPKVIVALGRPAAQTLLQTTTAISQLRGNFFDFPPPALAASGAPPCRLMPTFHPAYLLRNPPEKAKVWEDLKMVMRELGLRIPG